MVYPCWSCMTQNDIDELGDGGHFICTECGEQNYVIGTRVMSYDEYYEASCDSQASHRTEDPPDTDDLESDTPRAFRDDKWD